MKNNKIGRTLVITMMTLFMLTMLSTSTAKAEYYSVQEIRQQTSIGWHETYEAHGRTIQVDIEVSVPSVDTIPILQIKYPEQRNTDFLAQKGYGRVNLPGWFAGGVEEGQYGPEFNPRVSAKSSKSELPIKDIDWDQAYAEGNRLTLRDADIFMNEKLKLLFGDDAQIELYRVILQGRLREYNEKTGEYGEPLRELGSYELHYYPMLRGIPLIMNAVNTFQTRVNNVSGEWGMWRCEVIGTIYTPNDFNVLFSLREEAGMEMEDSPLCSFDTVKEVYEELINKGQIRDVYSVRLGYVCYQDPRSKDIFWAVPSWVMECEWYKSAKDEKRPHDMKADLKYDASGYSKIIVNAQQGKLLDPLDGSTDRSHCPKLLTWNDVR